MDITRYYLFTRMDTKTSVQMKRGTEAPKLVSAGGRWDVVVRPRDKSFTVWSGDDPRRMDVPILFDGWPSYSSVEDQLEDLNEMRFAAAEHSPPPQIQLQGALPVTGISWVIDGQIDYGDNVIWGDDGRRIRQDAVVHLLEYVAPDSLSVRPAAISHYHNVKTGETLQSIAKLEYGDAKLAAVLKTTNKIRDPKKLPKKIWIPAIVNK